MEETILQEWRKEQIQVAAQVIKRPDEEQEGDGTDLNYKRLSIDIKAETLLGGVDVSFGENNTAVAVYVVTKNDTLVYQDAIKYTLTVPYVSSYLAFREIEPLVKLVKKQLVTRSECTPEVILVDGNGIFHERGAGLASFLGVRTNMRTIGVGKKLYCMDGLDQDLVQNGLQEKLECFLQDCNHTQNTDDSNSEQKHDKGQCEKEVVVMTKCAIEPPTEKYSQVTAESKVINRNQFAINIQSLASHCNGFSVPLNGKSGPIAAVLVGHGGKMKRPGIKKQVGTKVPIFISIGHNISLQEAVKIAASVSYARIPEPVRRADLLGREYMRE